MSSLSYDVVNQLKKRYKRMMDVGYEFNLGVKIDCLLTFNRLKKLTQSSQEVASACKDSEIFEVDESNNKIRKIGIKIDPSASLKKYLQDNVDRLFQIDNMPSEFTLDHVEKYFKENSITTELIEMEKNKENKFSGVCYVLIAPENFGAEKDLIKELRINGNPLITHRISDTTALRIKSVSTKSKSKKTKPEIKFPPNVLLIIQSIPKNITAKQIKEVLNIYSRVGWVAFSEDKAIVRFKEQDGALLASTQICDLEERLNVDDRKLQMEVVTSPPLTAYWHDYIESSRKKGKSQSKKRKFNRK